MNNIFIKISEASNQIKPRFSRLTRLIICSLGLLMTAQQAQAMESNCMHNSQAINQELLKHMPADPKAANSLISLHRESFGSCQPGSIKRGQDKSRKALESLKSGAATESQTLDKKYGGRP